jgi:hypothetical protein
MTDEEGVQAALNNGPLLGEKKPLICHQGEAICHAGNEIAYLAVSV